MDIIDANAGEGHDILSDDMYVTGEYKTGNVKEVDKTSGNISLAMLARVGLKLHPQVADISVGEETNDVPLVILPVTVSQDSNG